MNIWGFHKRYENVKKKNHMEMKNTISDKILDGINISLKMAEKKIRKLEEKSTKITKLKRKKLLKKMNRASITYRKISNLILI